MTIKNAVLVVLVSFGLCQSAYAQLDSERNKQRCSESVVNLIGKHLGISNFSFPATDVGVITACVCKVWPKDNAITIAIFAYDDTDTQQYEKRLTVVLVNNQTNKVIATYKGSIQEDAAMTVGDNSLRIDTAPYDLAPGVRAFGLDVTTSYSQGCGQGGLGPTRTLFIQDGKEIRPILENFYVSSFRFIKGASCVTEGEIVIENINYSIGISKATTNGFANLVITATSSFKRKPFQYELHYDGKKYPTSPELNGGGAELDKWKNAP